MYSENVSITNLRFDNVFKKYLNEKEIINFFKHDYVETDTVLNTVDNVLKETNQFIVFERILRCGMGYYVYVKNRKDFFKLIEIAVNRSSNNLIYDNLIDNNFDDFEYYLLKELIGNHDITYIKFNPFIIGIDSCNIPFFPEVFQRTTKDYLHSIFNIYDKLSKLLGNPIE